MSDDYRLIAAATRALAAHQLPTQDAERCLAHPIGATLLALLCNAAAKHDPGLYSDKLRLVRHAISLNPDWWVESHRFEQCDYAADTVIYIENALARFSFHCKRTDPEIAALLENAPRSDRGWGGKALQPVARILALAWLTEQWMSDSSLHRVE